MLGGGGGGWEGGRVWEGRGVVDGMVVGRWAEAGTWRRWEGGGVGDDGVRELVRGLRFGGGGGVL